MNIEIILQIIVFLLIIGAAIIIHFCDISRFFSLSNDFTVDGGLNEYSRWQEPINFHHWDE